MGFTHMDYVIWADENYVSLWAEWCENGYYDEGSHDFDDFVERKYCEYMRKNKLK